MSLNIKDERTARLVRTLANETGESLTAAVSNAVKERLQRVQSARQRKAAVERILKSAWALPRLDARSPDEVLGYDDHGLPS